jgi:ACS family hexuronate transporter-like MFS transporter
MSKWSPAIAMMLVSVISYIDRSTLAVLIPSIRRETGMTATEYGWIVSAFSFGYMAANPLWGMILDRIGLRTGMLAAVAIWTVASAGHALLSGVAGFFVARLVLGLGEGATFPGALRTCVQTLDPVSRGRGMALSYSGGSLGALVTPFLVTPIFLAYGWRAAFWFTGLIGAAWLAWWLVLSRRADIQRLPEKRQASISFADRRLWAFIAMYALGNVPLGFVVNMTSVYLTEKFAVNQAQLGKILWIPPLGWELGYFFWGWLLDRRLRAARQNPLSVYPGVFLFGLALALPFAGAAFLPSLEWTLALFFTTMFATSSFIIPTVSYATQVFGERQSGLIAGLGAGSFSAMVFLLSPVFGKLLDKRMFETTFLLAACGPLLGIALWWVLSRDARRQRQS